MKSYISDAIILNKREISKNSLLISMLTKDYGKVKAIIFGIKNSKKRERASIIPLNVSNIEITIKQDMKIITNSTLEISFQNILKNFEKLSLSMYILNTIDNMMEENQVEENLFEKILTIFEYIDELEDKYFEDKLNLLKFIITFLRKIMIEFGIFDIDEFKENKYFLEYLKKKNLKEEIDENLLNKIIKIFEKYINDYFDIRLDYEKYIII